MLVILQQDFKQLEKKQTHKQDQSLLSKYPMKLLGLFVTEPQATITPWKAGLKPQSSKKSWYSQEGSFTP